MQETHAALAEQQYTTFVWVPAGTNIDLSSLYGEIMVWRTAEPIVWFQQKGPDPIHYGGCI